MTGLWTLGVWADNRPWVSSRQGAAHHNQAEGADNAGGREKSRTDAEPDRQWTQSRTDRLPMTTAAAPTAVRSKKNKDGPHKQVHGPGLPPEETGVESFVVEGSLSCVALRSHGERCGGLAGWRQLEAAGARSRGSDRDSPGGLSASRLERSEEMPCPIWAPTSRAILETTNFTGQSRWKSPAEK